MSSITKSERVKLVKELIELVTINAQNEYIILNPKAFNLDSNPECVKITLECTIRENKDLIEKIVEKLTK